MHSLDFDYTYKNYQKFVLNNFTSKFSRSESEEHAQEVWIMVHKNWYRYDGTYKVQTFILNYVKHIWADFKRHNSRKDRNVSFFDSYDANPKLLEAVSAPESEMDLSLSFTERRERVRVILNKAWLSKTERLCLEHRIFTELDMDGIAEATGINKEYVIKSSNRAMKKVFVAVDQELAGL